MEEGFFSGAAGAVSAAGVVALAGGVGVVSCAMTMTAVSGAKAEISQVFNFIKFETEI
jgi:hypothetical protein